MASIICYIGIGSNLGDASAHVQNALIRLAGLPEMRTIAQSSLFRSAPVDSSGSDYTNAVVRIETTLAPEDLLMRLQGIEDEFGRERPFINAPRTLDLDLLLYGQQTIDQPGLTVPHPRLTQRAFTLIPLLQIDPLISIPGRGPAHTFVTGVAGQVIARV
jgi:2-amino-4-hydroxy-6-hydroxymethyldihydropteridine diphosphokinase